MASDSNNPASNDQATERIPANPLSDARRAELTEARIVEIAEELEKAKQAALASDLEALVLRRRCQDLEKKLEKMPHLVNAERVTKKLRAKANRLEKKEEKEHRFNVGVLRDLVHSEERARSFRKDQDEWKNVARQIEKEFAEYPAKAAPASSLGKRKATLSSVSQPTSKKAKGEKIVPCSKCFINNRICDNNTSNCSQCVMRGLGRDCKRVKCKNFNTSTCKNKKCTFAHQDDNCHRLIEHMKLKRAHPGKAFAQNDASNNLANVQETGDLGMSIDDLTERFQDEFLYGIITGKHNDDEDSNSDDDINGVRF